ncbi:MAG TPA: hypothetical protein VLH85_09695 [Levilinea sp.]|nr:hypothetical protein [Levilinea sp.]
MLSPGKLVAFGFVLVLVGAALPFLMVLRVIEPTFFLVFLSFGFSMGGLLLGFVSAAYIITANRSRSRNRFEDYTNYDRDDQQLKE